MGDWLIAAFLGLIEGLTEFIPVSSTGHLLLAGHFLGFESAGKTFEVVIQLGAVLAIVVVYFAKLVQVFSTAHRDPAAMRFIISVLLAFLPAAVIGVLLHDLIKTVFFESPRLIAVMLILGGVILLVVDRFAPTPTIDDAEALPFHKALAIGFIQCLAMVPGVSRSGATVVGAMLMGVSKRAAAEFSFFLSLPTMAGAFAFDLIKNRATLSDIIVHSVDELLRRREHAEADDRCAFESQRMLDQPEPDDMNVVTDRTGNESAVL